MRFLDWTRAGLADCRRAFDDLAQELATRSPGCVRLNAVDVRGNL
jgi:hypothetical protein